MNNEFTELSAAENPAVAVVDSIALSDLLRTGSSSAHAIAEKNPLMVALVRGEVRERMYLALLKYLQPIYSSLEASLYIHRKSATFEGLELAAILRSGPLRSDVDFFEERLDREVELPNGGMCFEYAARLEELARKSPELLIAHVYTRYLGDLSGGQMIKKSVRKALHLTGGDGTQFYDFKEIEHTGLYKRRFRQWMDSLLFTDSVKRAICDETIEAFRLNYMLADEVWKNYQN